jgi:hypothetical protein
MIEGMTLRDWFAGQALASMAVYIEDGKFPYDIAEQAYMYAQAMLDEKATEDELEAEINIRFLKAKEEARKSVMSLKK